MSTSIASKTPDPGSQLAALAPRLEALDKFAEENNLALLTDGKGSFTAALSVADAIGRLKAMLTPEIMQPIMALQGTSLGFKTDKDKDGGYPVETVRDCFIEATLKGFKMVGNQSNIIAGRFYATKEGFEDYFLRQARAGKFTDYRDGYSIPKIVSESEAIVTASAGWVFNGKADELKNVQFSIRVNKGQGADAIIGKAKRKLKARIYERVTGTVITEGDAHEPIDVTVTAAGAPTGAAATPPAQEEKPTDEQKQLLKEALKGVEDLANRWLLDNKNIKTGETFLDVNKKMAERIIGQTKGFLTAIGANK